MSYGNLDDSIVPEESVPSGDAPPIEPAPRPRGQAAVAWLVICLLVAGIILSHQVATEEPGALAKEESTQFLILEIQAKLIVGAADLIRTAQPMDDDLFDRAEDLDTGSFGQRLRYVILAGELAGPKQALEALDRLDQETRKAGYEVPEEEEQLDADLRRIYGDDVAGNPGAPELADDERARVENHFGWFGKLALTPRNSPDAAARRSVIAPALRLCLAFVGVIGSLFLLGMAGLIGLISVLLMMAAGRTKAGLSAGSGNHKIYIETFAIWMVLYFTLSFGLSSIVKVPDAKLLVLGVTQLLSLSALAWPPVRGVPWRVMRQEIGLTAGRNPLVEPFVGVPAYAMMLPMMAVGLVVTLVLIAVQSVAEGALAGAQNPFAPQQLPSHPIINLVPGGGWWVRFQLLFLASVAAPIVEEIMFRGLLYRHLRDSSARWGAVASAVASAFLASFLFAIIHPQGPIAAPALMGIAFGLTFAREWRETLIPSMIAHGINNGLVLTLLLVALD